LVIATFTPPFQVVLVTALQAYPDVGLDQYLLGPHPPIRRAGLPHLPGPPVHPGCTDGAPRSRTSRRRRWADHLSCESLRRCWRRAGGHVDPGLQRWLEWVPVVVPVVAVFVFMQRQFIEGIMAGALKSW